MEKRRRRGQRWKNKNRRKATTSDPQQMTAPQGRTFENRGKEVVTVTPADLRRTEETQMVIPDFEIEAMARVLLPALRAFYADPKGQAAFEEWKLNQGLKEGNQ